MTGDHCGGTLDGIRRSWGSHDSFELTFSNVLVALGALSFCFPTFLGLRALSTYACAAKSSQAEFGTTHGWWFFMAFGPWAGTFKEGTRTFIAGT